MITRLLHRFSVWLYHRFTDHNPGGLGYPGSRGAVVGALRQCLDESLPVGVAFEVRENSVPGSTRLKVVVTLEVSR